MPSIIPTDRHQLTFMNSLDDMVAPDHPIRLMDALIERIIDQDPEFFTHLAPQESAGRPGYAAAGLIKLLIYGYINGMSSSRKLEVEARRNIEVIWLLSKQAPSYKTIADYRKDHPEQIRRVNEQIVRFLAENGWIDGKRVGIDGAKIKAYTGWDMLDEQSLDGQLERAHRQLEQWLARMAANDLADELDELEHQEQEPPAGGEGPLMEQISKLRQKIDRLEGLKQELGRQQTKAISPADPEARLMRSARRGKHPGYNLQAAVDSANKMIVSARISEQPTDFELLPTMFWASAEQLGTPPEEVLADTGYADLGDIQALEWQTLSTCYIPENNAPVKNRKIQFRYEPDSDRFICSQGKPLVATAKGGYVKGKQAYADRYRGTECQSCPVASGCTKAKDGVRRLSVFHGAGWRHRYARRLKSWYGRQRLAERKELVEHVFGTLRYWMGHIPLVLRGKSKVQTEIDLYSSGYNLKRWYSSGSSFGELMSEIAIWTTRPACPLLASR
jgi:transposase